MEITCPEHGGVIYVPGNALKTAAGAVKSLVVTCPVCEEEVLVGTDEVLTDVNSNSEVNSY